MKKILIFDSFSWSNFKGNEEFRKTCPGLGDKCEFLDGAKIDPRNQSRFEIDALITARDAFHRDDSIQLTDEVLRFFLILESSFNAKATLRRRNDILVSYWRGSGFVAPYAKWVYYNQSVLRRKQGSFSSQPMRNIGTDVVYNLGHVQANPV
jgi:hypothetical protein